MSASPLQDLGLEPSHHCCVVAVMDCQCSQRCVGESDVCGNGRWTVPAVPVRLNTGIGVQLASQPSLTPSSSFLPAVISVIKASDL